MPAVERKSLPRRDESHHIEDLTQEALEASRAGDWDRVAACYESRGLRLQTAVFDRTLAQRLMTIDAEIRSAALVAQAAVSSLLADNAQVKLQLRRLRESTGHLSAIGAIHREV